ncbi:MAG: hypothetical protein Q9187_001900 [Circinaria calcarea]
MRSLSITSTLVAAASVFFSSVLADVDPIVIKVSSRSILATDTPILTRETLGLKVLLQDEWHGIDVGGNGTSSANVNFVDPLTDVAGCTRDIPLLQQIRTNTIRVYAIDPTKDHEPCMRMLQDAGIYVVADLSAPNISINRDTPSWNVDLYSRYTSVIDVLAPYNNVLGFFAGNEVSNNVTNVDAIPFVKAAVRDMKSYISRRNYRAIGVGYAADDDAAIRDDLKAYLNCGPASDSIDFFGYNIYSWCGSDSSFEESGYADRTREFASYNIPAFFAEYGCNQPSPRVWDETIALFSTQMTGVWSGGIVYEYFQAERNYGLVSLSGNSASKLPDFTALSTQIAKVTPSGVQMSAYSPSNTAAQACPTTGSTWSAASAIPPTPNQQLCSCMVQNLTCVARSNIDADAIPALFAAACDPANGNNVCAGIANNGTTGAFGAYSGCQAADQLSWAFNAYYEEQARSNTANTNACDFGGNATTQSPSAPTQCNALVSQAGGAAGTGTVTSQPSGTGGVSGGSAATTTTGAAGMVTVPSFDFGLLSLGFYVVMAALVGADEEISTSAPGVGYHPWPWVCFDRDSPTELPKGSGLG